ncbi:xaa-Pro aminopeptidase 3-like [Ornithodoros turicata]|uniref:xaa-Pro aminopeptidase 3-like n=1 Tax=Ornithodoros turicata TaxID=34597 RepID=UPI00313887F1
MWTLKMFYTLRVATETTRTSTCRFCQAAVAQSRTASHTPQLYGQPTAETHPHLLRKGEVTPGIQKEEYQSRRRRLVENIRQLCSTSKTQHAQIKNHAIIVPSATKTYMSDKIPYPFRQNSDFFYLSGFQEIDSILLIHTNFETNTTKNIMFVPKKDPHAELWDGPRCGADGAVELLGVDDGYAMDDFESFCASLLSQKASTMLWYDHMAPTFSRAQEAMHDLVNDFKGRVVVESPRMLIQRLRLTKSAAEAELLRRSCRIAGEAMSEVMRASHPTVSEAQLHAKMEFECRIRGAERLAYPPVVAGGNRANVIHYIANDQKIEDGAMVLMDAGCELHGYASDLTRTWPVSGNFSEGHRELYELLLDVQQQLLKMLHEPISLDSLFHAMCDLLGNRLQEAGAISASTPKEELSKVAYQFCPHHVGHYLGMDVHDTPLIPRGIKLPPGAVVTVEPGIYIPESNHKVPEKFRGVGMRIEDDVLITENGPEVLTAGCPKTVEDIEGLFGRKQTRTVSERRKCCEVKQ